MQTKETTPIMNDEADQSVDSEQDAKSGLKIRTGIKAGLSVATTLNTSFTNTTYLSPILTTVPTIGNPIDPYIVPGLGPSGPSK